MVAIESDAAVVAEEFGFDGPVRSPHEAIGAVGVAEAGDHGEDVGVGIGEFRERPGVGDFEVEVWVARERAQECEAAWVVDGTVGHVVDDGGERGEPVEQGNDVRQEAGSWGRGGLRSASREAA